METIIYRPDIVLASFPRSGNTFLRNVLYEVYGIYSWNNIERYNEAAKMYLELKMRKQKTGKLNFKLNEKLIDLENKLKYRVLKSHELPSQTLSLCEPQSYIIYLVRDGRDALVSMAHHRKDIVEPGTDFAQNLKEAIIARGGSYFGGWSCNVKEWTKISHIVIRFEDFIKDPLYYTELFRTFINMPVPQVDKLPTFDSQRNGDTHFGGNTRPKYTSEEKKAFNKKFFRKGKVGGWIEEMPLELHKLFWKKHGKVMKMMGYCKDGSIKSIA